MKKNRGSFNIRINCRNLKKPENIRNSDVWEVQERGNYKISQKLISLKMLISVKFLKILLILR